MFRIFAINKYAMEKWKDITGFEELYEVSNYGKIRSLDKYVSTGIKHQQKILRKGKVLSLATDRYGYKVVSLTKNHKKHSVTVHRIVAKQYVDNPNNYPVINHKNTIKNDNHYKNLEWCTVKHNNTHAAQNNLFPFGEKHHKTKLTTKEVRLIRVEYKNGISSYKLADKYKVSRPTINNIINGKTWGKII